MDKRRESHVKFRADPGNKHHGEGKHFLPGIGHPRYIIPPLAPFTETYHVSSTGVIYCTDRANALGITSERRLNGRIQLR